MIAAHHSRKSVPRNGTPGRYIKEANVKLRSIAVWIRGTANIYIGIRRRERAVDGGRSYLRRKIGSYRITAVVIRMVGTNITAVTNAILVRILLVRVVIGETIVTGITCGITIRILLIGIVNTGAVIRITGVGGESGIAVAVAVGIGANVAAVACAITVGILLPRVVHGGTVIVRAGVFRMTRVTIAVAVRIHTYTTLKNGDIEVVNTCFHNRTITQI